MLLRLWEMAELLVCHAPAISQPDLLRLLELTGEQLRQPKEILKHCKVRSLALEKRLYDLLHGLDDELLQPGSLHDHVTLLSRALFVGEDRAINDAVDRVLKSGSQSEIGHHFVHLLLEPTRKDLVCHESRVGLLATAIEMEEGPPVAASGNLVLYIPEREEEKAGSRVARTEEELRHWLTTKRDVHPVDKEAFEEYLGDPDSLVLDTDDLARIYREFIGNFNKAALAKRCAEGLGIEDMFL